jgi:uncharacterized membrane protein
MSDTDDSHLIAPVDPVTNMVPLATLRRGLREAIRSKNPEISEDGFITEEQFLKYRLDYLHDLMHDEVGELTDLEQEVVESLSKRELISSNVEEEIEETVTLGQHLADKIASFGGSWTFLIIFFVFLAVWMFLNVIRLGGKEPWDPYPFILLNLVLSCLAAIQAPVIMMSQNRLNEKDRTRAEHDYQINLKAELEIQHLHEKMDQLLTQQWRRLVEIQKAQLELLREIRDR